MKRLFVLLLLPTAIILGCEKEKAVTIQDDAVIELRSNGDCADLGDCTDFNSCSDLAGRRAFAYTLLGPPITFTGQPSDGVPPVTTGLCSNPADGHPFTFKILRDALSPAAVRTIPHLGRVQDVFFKICVRPYVLPGVPTPPPFTPDRYPVCGAVTADWTFTGSDGDELSFSIEAESRPDCEDMTRYVISGYWIVTGGTGRFEDATGGGCLSGGGWGNFFQPNPDVPDQWHLEGGIDY